MQDVHNPKICLEPSCPVPPIPTLTHAYTYAHGITHTVLATESFVGGRLALFQLTVSS